LPTQEKTIIAHFPSSTKAQAAANALAAIGLTDNYIRRNSRYGLSFDDDRNDAIAGAAETLTGLTLFSTNSPNDENEAARVLMGADPSVSGLSTGDGLAGGAAFTLISFVPEEKVEEAVQLIKTNGGYT